MALSPMMQQYFITKDKYKDCILLYRLGDFYEMFFEDAIKASEILDLVLTGRDCGQSERAPMCGIPYHALDNYLTKLIEANCKVAICEQLTTPDQSKGLVERGVVRVVTPGTLIDENMLSEKQNNFLMSIYLGSKKAGLAWVDISTGECSATEFDLNNQKDMQNFILGINPREIIGNNTSLNTQLLGIVNGFISKVQLHTEYSFRAQYATDAIFKQFSVLTLEAFGLTKHNDAVSALGGLLDFLQETQKRGLSHINNIKFIKSTDFMSLDINTRRNLELFIAGRDGKKSGSLFNHIDSTSTSMGARLLNNYLEQPQQNILEINNRLDSVEELIENFILREGVSQTLCKIKDIERLTAKISYNNVTPKDCNTLASSLEILPTLKQILSKSKSLRLKEVFNNLLDVSIVYTKIKNAIVEEAPALTKDGGFIAKGYNSQLDMLTSLSHDSKIIIAEMESTEKQQTGIKALKIGYNRIFGYYIEVGTSNTQPIPSKYIRRQTVASGERYITEELKLLEEKILTATESALKIEKELFIELRSFLLTYVNELQTISRAIAQLDVLHSFSKLAVNNSYCKPQLSADSTSLTIIEGRHPVVESALKLNNFIANDTLLDENENRTMIITGPNMAGKSTYMRQVALIVLLAHIGCYVPATKAQIPLTDRIFTRVGAYDDLAFNQSTFMVEMSEVAYIINNATNRSLIVLDEVGRGTSTFDGLSIAWAVVDYITTKIKARTLFATHFHELTELEGQISGIKNYKVTVKELNNSVVFLHKISRGGANKSFGIEVASLAGVPQIITSSAKQILANLIENNARKPISASEVNIAKFPQSDSKLTKFIGDIDIDRTSPIEAFELLCEIKRIIGRNNEQN